jgi:hypothetical protein
MSESRHVAEVARSRFVRHFSCDGRFPVLIPWAGERGWVR